MASTHNNTRPETPTIVQPARASGEHRPDVATTEISALNPRQEAARLLDAELADLAELAQALRGNPPAVVLRGLQRLAALVVIAASSASEASR